MARDNRLYAFFCGVSTMTMCVLANADTVFTSSVIHYSNEAITAACVVTAILGAYLAAFWKPPKDIADLLTMNSTLNKFLLGVAGGIVSFLYVLHTNNRLTVLHPAWVLCIAIITPAAVQLAFPLLGDVVYKVLSKFTGNREP